MNMITVWFDDNDVDCECGDIVELAFGNTEKGNTGNGKCSSLGSEHHHEMECDVDRGGVSVRRAISRKVRRVGERRNSKETAAKEREIRQLEILLPPSHGNK